MWVCGGGGGGGYWPFSTKGLFEIVKNNLENLSEEKVLWVIKCCSKSLTHEKRAPPPPPQKKKKHFWSNGFKLSYVFFHTFKLNFHGRLSHQWTHDVVFYLKNSGLPCSPSPPGFPVQNYQLPSIFFRGGGGGGVELPKSPTVIWAPKIPLLEFELPNFPYWNLNSQNSQQ